MRVEGTISVSCVVITAQIFGIVAQIDRRYKLSLQSSVVPKRGSTIRNMLSHKQDTSLKRRVRHFLRYKMARTQGA